MTGAARADLGAIAARTFGRGRTLSHATRLRGGSRKSVHRLTADDGSTAVAYVWDEVGNHWPGAGDATGDPLAGASGIELFATSRAVLADLDVRTPRLLHLEREPVPVAVVEDLRGGSLAELLGRDPHAAEPALARLAAALRTMRGHRGRWFGRVGELDRTAQDRPCERIVLDRALADLADAAGRVARITATRSELDDLLRRHAAAVVPRDQLSLVHGELGPDHVLLDGSGEPVLIDIEGLMFFDAEWEHAYLRLRFHEHHRHLDPGDLDDDRMRLYRLAHHLSLVAGPLRLLDGGFPDREPMLGIVRRHVDQALALLERSR